LPKGFQENFFHKNVSGTIDMQAACYSMAAMVDILKTASREKAAMIAALRIPCFDAVDVTIAMEKI
jgi:uncharacterized protein (UPF0254 family)